MDTHNIISTPNIQGNIGSCTSNEIKVISKRESIWTNEATFIVTNSCTGQVEKYVSWEFTLSTLLFPTMILFLLFIIALFKN